MNLKKIGFRKIIKVLGFVIILFVVAGIIYNNKPKSYYQASNKLIGYSEQLGYSNNDLLAQYKDCWGVFPTTCGEVIYYTTNLNKSGLQEKIDKVTKDEELPKDFRPNILMEINMLNTGHKLEVKNPNNLLSDSGWNPATYEWNIFDDKERWVIRLYEIADDKSEYYLDGSKIEGNIVTVMNISE